MVLSLVTLVKVCHAHLSCVIFIKNFKAPLHSQEMTPPRSNGCDTKTDFRYKTGDTSPNYKYQNKDERSERSVRDKIAMFSNATPCKTNGYATSPTQYSPTSPHKFGDPLKRPLAREPSPFGSPTSPLKDSSPSKDQFKNNEIVSHTYLTNLEVDSSFNKNHYQESGVNCQSESSAYSSLSTSEILCDKSGDFTLQGCNGSNGYSGRNGETTEYTGNQFGNEPQVRESYCGELKENSPYTKYSVNNASVTESRAENRRHDSQVDLKSSNDGKENVSIYNFAKTKPLDAYKKFSTENFTDADNKSSHSVISRSNSSLKTPEYKINDFSSLPRKLKVLKSQESRETSPETEGYTSKLTRTISFNNPPLLQSRSHSMIDIHRNNAADSINKLMEKRKKNISKLKGLIIPEKPEISVTSAAICNLPEIKIKTPSSFLGSTEFLERSQQYEHPSIMKQPIPLERTVSNPDRKQPTSYERKRNNSVDNTIDQVDIARNLERETRKATSTWDLNDIPKYSPAFKRKSLTVYEKTKQLPTDANTKKVSPPKPPRKSYEGKINNDQIDALISFDRIKENCKTRKISATKISSSESDGCTADKSTDNESTENRARKTSENPKYDVISSSENKQSKSNLISDWNTKATIPEKGIERLKPSDRLSVKKLNIHTTAYETETSESDNDSAISSNVSPPLSPMKRDEIEIRSQQRKISTNSSSSSTLTSGDDTIHYLAGERGDAAPKRILKPQSVEAVNRKNVLSSAKFRSGDKTNDPPAKDNDIIHEDLARCVDNRLKAVKNGADEMDSLSVKRKDDDDEYSSSTLNENDEEDFEFNDECTDKIYSRRLSNVKVAYLDVMDSADSSDDILSSSDLISEGANSDDEMSVTSSECKNHVSNDDWGNTPDEICSKIEEYIDDLEIYSQEIEEKRSKLISERTKKVRRTQESVKIDKFVRTNEFLRNARLSETNDKSNDRIPESDKPAAVYLSKVCNKLPKEKEIPKPISRSRVERLKKEIEEVETTETEASVEDTVVPKPKLATKPSLNGKPRESTKIEETKTEYSRSTSTTEIVKPATTPISRKSTSVSDVRKFSEYSRPNGAVLPESKPSTMLPTRLPTTHHMRVSSLDSTTSDDSFTMQREQFGSITSIASSTSLISQQVSSFD